MGERQIFQPLTGEDRATVLLYRAGIVLSTVLIAGMAFVLAAASGTAGSSPGMLADVFLYSLHASVGLCVIFIHLYVGKFKTFLKGLYLISLGCLSALLIIGRGTPAGAISQGPYGPLLLLPLSGCLGFVTAKEAFCFRLFEGYLLALFMPACLLLAAAGFMSSGAATAVLFLVAGLLLIFTLRKVFQPLAYDIGDKTAYR
jgi:uncharacterized integral membrane protein